MEESADGEALLAKLNENREPSYWNKIDPEPIGFVDSEGNAVLNKEVKGGYLYWGYAPDPNVEHRVTDYKTLCNELLEALKYHQAQTRPIIGTIEAIAKASASNAEGGQ